MNDLPDRRNSQRQRSEVELAESLRCRRQAARCLTGPVPAAGPGRFELLFPLFNSDLSSDSHAPLLTVLDLRLAKAQRGHRDHLDGQQSVHRRRVAKSVSRPGLGTEVPRYFHW